MSEEKYNGYDSTIIYSYQEYPDVNSCRYDNCDNALF